MAIPEPTTIGIGALCVAASGASVLSWKKKSVINRIIKKTVDKF